MAFLSSCHGIWVEDVLENITIRESLPGDIPAIEALYPAAFPDEDLLPVVRALLSEPDGVLSLVAHVAGSMAGHILFCRCSIAEDGDALPGRLGLLGPLAVTPARQKQGVGSTLIRHGIQQMEAAGIKQVLVLGDPAYYGRSGFLPEADIAPPYPLQDEWHGAWQSIRIAGAPSRQGTLSVPAPWRQPVLWGP